MPASEEVRMARQRERGFERRRTTSPLASALTPLNERLVLTVRPHSPCGLARAPAAQPQAVGPTDRRPAWMARSFGA